MQPRAFVVMPFGNKRAEPDLGVGGSHEVAGPIVDFDGIFSCLLKPALQRAGYEVSRGDSNAGAGDIRTDMYFELVTADLVVADISVRNANVYYELGIRHAVCPRGVFVLSARTSSTTPFDVAPDRRIAYDATPFIDTTLSSYPTSSPADSDTEKEVQRLTRIFRDATTLDRQSVGSPVYAHLPGLKPVNWDNIETSKAKYFNALQNDWMDCVRVAQANGYPGDILTLARNAPTRVHEARILYEAAIALINLSRCAAAEAILEDVVRLDPDHASAHLDLASVAAHLGHTTIAEQRLRTILNQHQNDPRADDLLGQVFRYLWRLTWQGESCETRRRKAAEACQLAISAVHCFIRAHRSDPKTYFAGFNALILAFVLESLDVPEAVIGAGRTRVDRKDLHAAVRYTANSEQQDALEHGDYLTQFWCTTTLSGLLLIDGEEEAAIQKIREACSIRGATTFQLQTLRDRLQLLTDLDIQTAAIKKALEIVDESLNRRGVHCHCKRVILWRGHRLDEPDPARLFATNHDDEMSRRMRDLLQKLQLTSADLAICPGMDESDILFAEMAAEMGARVRLMMREPVASEVEQNLHWPPLASAAWRERLLKLRLEHPANIEVWIDTEHLGPVQAGEQSPADVATRRLEQWLINTAKMEAWPADSPGSEQPKPQLHAIILTVSRDATPDPYVASLVHEIEQFNRYQGHVSIITQQSDAANADQAVDPPRRWAAAPPSDEALSPTIRCLVPNV